MERRLLMPWGRMDDQLHDNGKVWSLHDKEFRVWIYSISYCNRKRDKDPVGTLTQDEAETVCRLAKATPKVIAGLLRPRPPRDTSFWEREGAGYLVHDFPEYGPRLDRTAAERKRAERERKQHESRRDDDDGHAAVTRDIHMRAEPGPGPGPDPSTSEHPQEDGTPEKHTLSPPAAAAPALPPSAALESRYPAEFETWWAAYPKKREKVEAFAVYEKTLKAGATPLELLEAARNYATLAEEQRAEDRYIKLPATFLSVTKRPWLDFRDGVPRAARSANGHATPKAWDALKSVRDRRNAAAGSGP